MDENQLTDVLLKAQSEDQEVRSVAEQWLMNAQNQNGARYIKLLSDELASNQKPAQSRKLAGLLLKNQLTAKDENRRKQLIVAWQSLKPEIRLSIKQSALATLGSPEKEARSTAAQVVAAIAIIELPLGEWSDLISILLNNMQQNNDFLKQHTLEALGYICEEIDADVLAQQSNQILTAVCKGIKDPNNDVKLAGCNALFNSLDFVKNNFEKPVERGYIMAVLVEAASSPSIPLQVASLECLVKVATLYYDKLPEFIQKIFNLTVEAIKKGEQEVALQGIEFWSTIAEIEADIIYELEEAQENGREPERKPFNFVRGALRFIVPLLTEALTKQEDEPDDDTWNVAMAAGTCLNLMASTVDDEIVQYVMPFVEGNIKNENWKFREAATLAFGAILEGPKNLGPLISQALPVLMSLMNDPNEHVKDTVAWTLGRVCQQHSNAIGNHLDRLLEVLIRGLNDIPKVAANCCWAIHNLAMAQESHANSETHVLSKAFPFILNKLAEVTNRPDVDENNLLSSAYESINSLIQHAAKDCLPFIVQFIVPLLSKFQKAFSMTPGDEQTELLSQLCSVTQTITQKLGGDIKPYADSLMGLYLQVISSKTGTTQEEVLIAIGALSNSLEADFERYMAHFKPFLIRSLQNSLDYQVCTIAVGLVGDIARALGPKILPYCDEIVTILLQNLQNPDLDRSVKPPIFAAFADISLAIGGDFVKYLNYVMAMLIQASQTQVDMDDYDLVDYLSELYDAILEAYTGILQGIRDNYADQFLPYVPPVLQFIAKITSMINDGVEDSVIRGAIGVLGDLGHTLGPKVKDALRQQFVPILIEAGMKSRNPTTKDTANWAKDVLAKLN